MSTVSHFASEVHSRLVALAVALGVALAAWLALGTGTALALTVHPYLCQITGASPGSASECHSGGSAAPSGLSDPFGVTISGGDVWSASPGTPAADEFDSTGAFVSQIPGSGSGYSFGGLTDSVAVNDSSGTVYLADSGPDVVDVFGSTGAFVATWNGSTTPSGSFGHGFVSNAVDNSSGSSSGDVYVLDSQHQVIDKLDSSGNPVSFSGSASYIAGSQLTGTPSGSFTFNNNSSGNVIAVDSAGNLYVADAGNNQVDEFSSAGTFVQSITGAGTPTGSFGSILGIGVDNTSGDVYVVDGSNQIVDEFSSTGTFLSQVAGGLTPAGSFSPQGVAVDSSGDVYVTDGADNVIDKFGVGTVTVPDVSTGSASTIQATSATLSGTVNPDGTTLTDCRFDYGVTTSYGLSAPCATTRSGSSPVPVSAQIAGLQPDTTYHFRLVAGNSNGSNPGSDATLQTESPPYTTNLTASSVDLNAEINPSGVDTTYHFDWGTSTAYGNSIPVPDGDVGSGTTAVTVTQHLTGLTPDTLYHWRVVATSSAGTTTGPDQTFIYQPAVPSGAGCPNAQFRTGPGASLPDCRAYEQVSPVDKDGQDVGFPAQGVAVDGDSISYYSAGAFAGQQSSSGLIDWYLSSRDGSAWSTQGIEPPVYNPQAFTAEVQFEGWSPDLQHMIVETKVAGAPQDIYLRNPDGSFTLVNPGAPLVTGGGDVTTMYEGASPDFSHILFAPTEGSSVTDEWVNGTVSPASPTVVPSQCTTGNAGQDGPGGNCATTSVSLTPTQFVNVDGYLTSTAYFTSDEELTNDANTGTNGQGADLYEYDAQTQTLTDLSADSNPADTSGAQVQGVVGASADGSYVYFVADGALSGAAAAGQPNLYVWHDGRVAFITTLTNTDSNDWSTDNEQRITAAQVSGDGAHLVFASHSALTGYDNAGFNEIYRYDAGSGSVTCVSCDPGGAAASGSATFSQNQGLGTADYPEQTNISTDGSRVFFQTPDSLVPEDANAAGGCAPVAGQPSCLDVYEWEADGAGSCQSSSDNGGCLYLISTGQSDAASFFEGASASGNDVFFATRDQLVGQDTDGGDYDIYDARVDGGLASQNPSPAASCSGTACQGPASAAPAAVTAASVTFTGPGNVAAANTPAAAPAGKVTLLTKVVRGTSFMVRVRVPGKGRVTISAPAVRPLIRSIAKAGTYGLKVTLTAKGKRELGQKRKLKLTLKIAYAPPGAKASTATVRLTVEPVAARRPTRKHGGAR